MLQWPLRARRVKRPRRNTTFVGSDVCLDFDVFFPVESTVISFIVHQPSLKLYSPVFSGEFYGWGAYPELGYNKWLAMIDEMGQNCEVIVHVGDTNAGGTTPCLHDAMVLPLNDLKEVGKKVSS